MSCWLEHSTFWEFPPRNFTLLIVHRGDVLWLAEMADYITVFYSFLSPNRCGREPISEMETIAKSMCNIKIAHECRRTCKQGFDVTQRSQSFSDCAERADFTAQCEDLSDAKITEIPEDSVLSLAEVCLPYFWLAGVSVCLGLYWLQ